ncbi:MAG: prepilin-type N-terminal cleavage/methylation domain-containing protein [bacterium]|nr:prepilin-type N-terminal cleavage/methylation domain-containing protein [bacterium]
MNRRRTHGRDGFTLMEVLVALALLGGGVFFLLQTYSNAFHAHEEFREEVTLRNLMEMAMGIGEVELRAGTPTGSGEFGKRYPDCEYAFDAQEVSTEEYPGLYNLEVSIELPDGEIKTMNTLVFAPSYE